MRRNKVCHLIRKNAVEKTEDYTSSGVKLEKLHNSVNFENLIRRFMGFTKNTDFNDFIDAETTFDDIKSQQIRFEDVEKNQMEFKSKLFTK